MIKRQCPFCNKLVNKTNKHHLPSSKLFPQPPCSKYQLITVPGCTMCHDSINKDEEYFKVMLAFNQKVFDNPRARDFSLREIDRFRKGHGRGLLISVLNEVSPIILPEGFAVNVQAQRVENYLRYLFRGLYFNQTGRYLSCNHDFLWASNLNIYDKNKSSMENLFKEHLYHRSKIKCVVPKVFEFSFLEHEGFVAICLCFYGAYFWLLT